MQFEKNHFHNMNELDQSISALIYGWDKYSWMKKIYK